MFYSQFILAKKGPLGTIWIAAHLERKLKKNQVADTDIGDSVDSILFPDVPIALRLSSHLLLGVVRIYSRKVNYLFHDCSEALLKVKQAFRSTAVDLPPEESTAPYHSITLPETFDLDDFELPDSALLNGNFDDRHVSSREQITLQDTLDGTGYSTSQFGLDERFGDGDASQIGLDLDEELLLGNNLNLQHDPDSHVDTQKGEGASDLTKMDIDETQLGGDEDRSNEASRELSELLCNDRGKHLSLDVQNVNRIGNSSHRLVFNIQTPDLNEVFLPDDHIGGPSGAHNIDMDFCAANPPPPEFNEFANFPSTPIPANCQEPPSSNLQENLPDTNIADDKLNKPINQEVECPDATSKNLVNATSTNSELDNIAQAVSSLTSILDEPKSDSVAPQCSSGMFPSSNPVNDVHHIHNDSNDAATSGKLVSIESTDPKLSEVSRVLPSSTSFLPEAVPDSLVPPINQEVECPDATRKDLVNATLTNSELDNRAQAVSSLTSILDEPKSDSVAPQCSSGIFPSSNPVNDVHHIHNDSNYAATCGKLVSIESTDPKLSEVSRVLPSSTSVLPKAVPDSLVPPSSDGTVDTPRWVGFESTLRTTNNSHAGIAWSEASNLPVSVDCGIPYENTTRLSNPDQRRVEEANSYQTKNFSALSSDFQMRSCTSVSNQANLMSPVDMLLENTPWFSSRDQHCNLGTPMMDQELHFSGSSMGLQGFPSVAMDTTFGLHHKLNDIQLGHPNCFSSSEFSEPERMLFAPSGNVNLSSDLGLQTLERGVVESDGSVDRISNLHGKKRRLLDNTPESQNAISPNMSGILQKKPNNDYIIPKDDDLLASILVGRRTPALKIGPTPPLPKPPSSKRPRLTQKLGLPKRRKVLLDDAIVLHADAIRQQLMNTEDIRRMRRKAPCTRPEIWRIQKSFVEEDIFCESIFIGISDVLNSLPQRYDPVKNMHAQANGHPSIGEAIKDFEVSNDGKEIAVQSAVIMERVDGEIQGASGGELIDAGSYKNVVSVDAQERLESPFEVPFDSKIEEKHNNGLADAERNSLSKEFQTSHEIAEVNGTALHAADLVSFEKFTSADCVAVNDDTLVHVEDLSGAKAASIAVEDMGVDMVNITSLVCPQDEQAGLTKDHSGGASASMIDRFMVEVGADLSEDSSTVIEHANSSVLDLGLVCGDAAVHGKKAASEVTCGEMPKMVSLPVPPSTEGERDPSALGENSCMNAEGGLTKDHSGGASASMIDRFMVVGADLSEDSSTVIEHANSTVLDLGLVCGDAAVHGKKAASEVTCGEMPKMVSLPVPPSTEGERVPSAVGENSCMNAEGGPDVESTPMELAATRESSDFCSAIDDIDTDFLNVDDDAEYDEETINDAPHTEEAQSLENSGWSSRTRGVARYLKTMFDQESGRARKSVAVDHLLAGKTRKEASRMFFETLVLKTRDYIHVEQDKPFACINIMPRIKLLKTEF